MFPSDENTPAASANSAPVQRSPPAGESPTNHSAATIGTSPIVEIACKWISDNPPPTIFDSTAQMPQESSVNNVQNSQRGMEFVRRPLFVVRYWLTARCASMDDRPWAADHDYT